MCSHCPGSSVSSTMFWKIWTGVTLFTSVGIIASDWNANNKEIALIATPSLKIQTKTREMWDSQPLPEEVEWRNEDRRYLLSAWLYLPNTAPVSLGWNCHHPPISARHWKLKMTAPSWSDNRVGLCIICVSMTPQPKLFHYLLSGLIYMLKGEMTGWNLVESCMRESPRGWWAIALCHPLGFLWEERVEPHKCNPFCPSLGPQVSQKNIMVSVMARKAAGRAKQNHF